MAFRPIGALASEVIGRVKEARAAAVEGAGPVEGDDLEEVVTVEEDAADLVRPTELPGRMGGGSRIDGPREEDAAVEFPGVRKRNRSADQWTVRKPVSSRRPARAQSRSRPTAGAGRRLFAEGVQRSSPSSQSIEDGGMPRDDHTAATRQMKPMATIPISPPAM